MGLVWNPWGLPYVINAAVLAGAAVWMYFAAPRKPVNRALAVALVFEATITIGYGLAPMSNAVNEAYAFHVVAMIGMLLYLPTYLVFLGVALRTPLVRPFRPPWVRAALLVAGFCLALTAVFQPAWFVGVPVVRPQSDFNWATRGLGTAFELTIAAAFLYSLAAAFSAFRRAKADTIARQRSKWFMVAFGTRDIVVAAFFLGNVTFVRPGTVLYDVFASIAIPIASAGSVLLLGYGILRWQLFDLDLHVKWTLRQSTVGAAFLGIFLVVTQLAQNGFAQRFGWVWGGLAAGLLLFALVPLQRLAERVANAAMPHVDASAEYLAYRRAEIYQGALEEILVDGTITPKERAVLRRLREKLGLGERTAAALEADARNRRKPAEGFQA